MEECEQPIEVRLGALLRERHLTMATAESCTGGSIAGLMTSVPGSSDYFLGGVVSYCNLVKQQVLGVAESDLRDYGAVSRPVVETDGTRCDACDRSGLCGGDLRGGRAGWWNTR